MNKKSSYFQKHKEKIAGTVDEGVSRQAPIRIGSSAQGVFESGQTIMIDKPLHWTSFDVVRKIRNSIGIKKVGHAGTLDPLATGLLIVCTGKFTKRINEYMAAEKEYTGTFTLGATTATYDAESTPENFKDTASLTETLLNQVIPLFIGSVAQKPPMYSAIKKQGTALYELARRGETVEIEPRNIFIKEFELTQISFPVISFRVVCSTGTYIRSLAHDFGEALGCGAYLSSLRRTRIGEFWVKDAQTLSEWQERMVQLADEKKDHQNE